MGDTAECKKCKQIAGAHPVPAVRCPCHGDVLTEACEYFQDPDFPPMPDADDLAEAEAFLAWNMDNYDAGHDEWPSK